MNDNGNSKDVKILAPPAIWRGGDLSVGEIETLPLKPQEIMTLMSDRIKVLESSLEKEKIAVNTIVNIVLALVYGMINGHEWPMNEEMSAIKVSNEFTNKTKGLKLEVSPNADGDIFVRIVERGHEDLRVVKG